MILFERAVARAKELYFIHAREAAEIRGDVGPKSLEEILPDHVERQEEVLHQSKDLLTSWGIDFNKLKLALALTDIAKANPDVTFNALLAFKDRQSQSLPDTAVRLAMSPVGIELVEVIRSFDRIISNACENATSAAAVLGRLKGLSNVLLHAEAGRLMVAETIEILAQTEADLTGDSGAESPTRREAFRLGAEVADQITGHDSFRAGFGREIMPQALAAMLRELSGFVRTLAVDEYPGVGDVQTLLAKTESVAHGLQEPGLYPPSQNMEGFILQILDRLEALEASTQLRYVKEGIAFQGKSLEDSITGGIHANHSGLQKIYVQLLYDIDCASMSATDKHRLRESPFMEKFEQGLAVFGKVLEILIPPATKGQFYMLEVARGKLVEIRDVEDLEKYYPAAFERKAREWVDAPR